MFMLDTNILVTAIRRRGHPIREKLLRHMEDGLCISSISYTELMYGVYRSQYPEKNLVALQGALSCIEILPFDIGAAVQAGQIMAYLAARGEKIGDRDALIAAHARSLHIPIVTHNVREFMRVPGLMIEDWLAENDE